MPKGKKKVHMRTLDFLWVVIRLGWADMTFFREKWADMTYKPSHDADSAGAIVDEQYLSWRTLAGWHRHCVDLDDRAGRLKPGAFIAVDQQLGELVDAPKGITNKENGRLLLTAHFQVKTAAWTARAVQQLRETPCPVWTLTVTGTTMRLSSRGPATVSVWERFHRGSSLASRNRCWVLQMSMDRPRCCSHRRWALGDVRFRFPNRVSPCTFVFFIQCMSGVSTY